MKMRDRFPEDGIGAAAGHAAGTLLQGQQFSNCHLVGLEFAEQIELSAPYGEIYERFSFLAVFVTGVYAPWSLLSVAARYAVAECGI